MTRRRSLLTSALRSADLDVSGGGRARGAGRGSRLTTGTTLVHADLHNHTLLSDGTGEPEAAFASMRSAGLDVAALTDHASLGDSALADLLPPAVTFAIGITPQGWTRAGRVAAAADDPGSFTAIRGFEWSQPLLGHVNVWFTDDYVDVLDLGGMGALYDFLAERDDALAGFNHPGREPLRFGQFGLQRQVRDRVVSLEMFNRYDDFLFEGVADGARSPLSACLDAGWRTGILGVTDEHGDDWGVPDGKGRAGLWVTRNDRAGVQEALRARRFFATNVSGLRLDATASVGGTSGGDAPVRMGGVLRVDGRVDVRFELDLDRGDDWRGRALTVQALRPGGRVPSVPEVATAVCGEVTSVTVSLDPADGDWVVLRVADPTGRNATPGPDGHPCNDLAVAYSSPWWLERGLST